MAGVYRPRHPERTVFYRVFAHHFEHFLSEYESRFEREYGFFRPVVKEVETRGFCPSCQAKRVEMWGEWIRETLLWDVPHRQVVFTIPKMPRIFFKYNRRLLGDLCRAALRALNRYFEVAVGEPLVPGVIAVIQTFFKNDFPFSHKRGRAWAGKGNFSEDCP